MNADKVDPATLALRAPPRPVTRLSRRSVSLLVVVVTGGLLGATLWSLRDHVHALKETPTELHNVDRISHAEGLEQLPADYSHSPPPAPIPMLGPPLPGDLGEAMLRSGQLHSPTAVAPVASASAPTSPSADQLARQRELEDAAKAPLFFKSASERSVAAASPAVDGPSSAVTQLTSSTALANASAGVKDDHASSKQQFLDRTSSDESSVSSHRLQPAASDYVLSAGDVIPAALITGIRSDLPGMVLATVTETIRDSVTGSHILIPQGTRLIGQYDSQVSFRQQRVQMVWNRLMFPDGSSLTLDRFIGVDTAGNAGLEDQVDRHVGTLLAGAALSTLIGIGAELAAPDRSDGQSQVVIATRQSVQDSVNQVGQELTRRNLDVQPTLSIRQGFPLRVLVSRDLVLRPYQPLFIETTSP